MQRRKRPMRDTVTMCTEIPRPWIAKLDAMADASSAAEDAFVSRAEIVRRLLAGMLNDGKK